MSDAREEVFSVRVIGDKQLSVPAAPVLEINDEIRDMSERMIKTMHAFDGIGLAAPQVGISLRMAVFGLPRKPLGGQKASSGEVLLLPQMPLVLINPRIVSSADDTSIREEGCLSVPGIYGRVERPSTIVVEAQGLDGESLTMECGGLLGCCIQHEIDHLNGILFVKRLIPDDLYKVRWQVAKLKQQSVKTNYRRSEF